MIGLIFDTTSNNLFIGLTINGVRRYKVIKNLKFHNKILFEETENLLTENSLTIDDISCIAAVTGPGSYTGIRLGVTAANAIAFAKNIKRIDIDALSCVTPLKQCHYFTAIFARVDNYYYAEFANETIVNEGDIDKNELLLKEKYYIRNDDDYSADLVFDEFDRRYQRGEFVGMFTPKYLKKAQAERLKK